VPLFLNGSAAETPGERPPEQQLAALEAENARLQGEIEGLRSRGRLRHSVAVLMQPCSKIHTIKAAF
jgi:hypothetical protein